MALLYYYMLIVSLAWLAFSAQADWVPMRWPSSDPESLELLRDHPVNCLLLDRIPPGFIRRLPQGVVALDAHTAPRPVARHLMPLDRPGIAVTGQGVWPGVRALEEGKFHSAASGGTWIDTNAGFLRYLRAAAHPQATLWIAVRPPAKAIYPVERYLQAIGDAAMAGARWVLDFDEDFTKRLLARDPKALKDWKRIGEHLRLFEQHKDWRAARALSNLALVQSPESGALVSGGVLDMIAVKHMPVNPIPSKSLDGESLRAAQFVVNLDAGALTPEQVAILKKFIADGGTMLTGPPGWRFPDLKPGQVTLAAEDVQKLDQIGKEVNSLVGRRNVGARLFNVSSMLSNLSQFTNAAGKRAVLLHLVNYSDYAAESVTVHLLGAYKSTSLYLPDKAQPVRLELYPIDEGVGLDLDRIETLAAVVLEP